MKPDAPRSFGAQLKARSRGRGLHAGGARDDCGPVGSCGERAGARATTAATCRDRARAVRGARPDWRDRVTRSSRARARLVTTAAVDELRDVSLPLALTVAARPRRRRADAAARGSRIPQHASSHSPGQEAPARRVWRWSSRARARPRGVRVMFVGLAAVRNRRVRGAGDCRGSRRRGRHGARPAEARCGPRATTRPTLLVLDNFEQVLDAAPLVADLLASVAALRVLVTSRAPLRVRGEREYAVGPLALDVDVDATSPADLARSPAVRLFVERVRDVQPDFHLTSANGPTVSGDLSSGSTRCRSPSSWRPRGSRC